MVLNLDHVRRLARSEGLQEGYYNAKSRVVSFAKAGESLRRVRFNVYYTTGTVGTCINHPRQGRTQLFRRNVSMENLQAIFRDPRVHTGKGYHRKSDVGDAQEPKRRKLNAPLLRVHSRAYVTGYSNCTVLSEIFYSGPHRGKIKVKYDDGRIYHVGPEQLEEVMEEVVDEETAARQQLSLLQEEASQLELAKKKIEKQMTGVQNILESFEAVKEAARLEAKRLQAIAAQKAIAQIKHQEQEAKRIARGRYLYVYLTDCDHVQDCFDETVTSIACGETATILLYERGSWAWSSGLTTQLYNKLKGRQNCLPKPIYVALGSQNRYYVEFADGKSQWVGCDQMSETLSNDSRGIASVAFGECWNSYFIVFKDGGWQYSDIPQGLDDVLDRRQRRGDLTCVSLGPAGEYFVAVRNGRAWWGGMTTKGMAEVGKFSSRIRFMDFGADDSYLFRYC